jgi:hypothetical protein
LIGFALASRGLVRPEAAPDRQAIVTGPREFYALWPITFLELIISIWLQSLSSY